MNPPLIEKPERISRARRTVGGAVTAAGWLVYAWLWVPLLTFLAWLVGIRTAWQRLYLEQNAVDPFVLAALPVIALLCGLLLIGWAEYNRVRFAKADQRRRRNDVDEEAVTDRLGAPAEVAEMLRSERVVTVSLDATAQPKAARAGSQAGA